MTPDELKAELEAECDRMLPIFQFGNFADTDCRSAILDQARERMEAIIGQPCLAQFDGDTIKITSPVINYEYIVR
jgi:hypothetical protein